MLKGVREGKPLLQFGRVNARHLADVFIQHRVDHRTDDELLPVHFLQVPVELDRADLDDLVRNIMIGAAGSLVPFQIHHNEALRIPGYKT